jgi:hypothetical protein
VLAASGLLIGLHTPARGAPVTWEFSAVVEAIWDGGLPYPLDTIVPGTQVTGSLTFERDTPGGLGRPGAVRAADIAFAVLLPPIDESDNPHPVTIRGRHPQAVPPDGQFVNNAAYYSTASNGFVGFGIGPLLLELETPPPYYRPPSFASVVGTMSLGLSDTPNDAFPVASTPAHPAPLPAAPPPLELVSEIEPVDLNLRIGASTVTVRSRLSSIVPEPGSVAMLALGLALLAARTRCGSRFR